MAYIRRLRASPNHFPGIRYKRWLEERRSEKTIYVPEDVSSCLTTLLQAAMLRLYAGPTPLNPERLAGKVALSIVCTTA